MGKIFSACAGVVEELIQEEELIFSKFSNAVSKSTIPNLATTRHVILKVVENVFGLLSYNFTETVELVEFIGKLGVFKNQPLDGNTYLALQNAVIAFSTPYEKKYDEVLKDWKNAQPIAKGPRVIYGYGADFPSDEAVGQLYVTTMLSWLLNYDEASGQYVLNQTTHENENEICSSLCGALNDKKYYKTKMYFDAEEVDADFNTASGKQLKLTPVKIEAWENGEVTQTVKAGEDGWQMMVTASVTLSFYVFEVVHASMHLMTGACVTAFLLTVPSFADDVFPLINKLAINVFLKQEEALVLLVETNGVFLTGKPFDAKGKIVRENCYQVLNALVQASQLDQNPMDAFMSNFVLPKGCPDGHKEHFAPGMRSELAAAIDYSNQVNSIFESHEKKGDFTKDLKRNLKKIGLNGFMDPLDNLGNLLLCANATGGVFHSQTMLTKIGLTPLVSPFSTKKKQTKADSGYLKYITDLVGTINEFDYDEQFGDFEIESNNPFYPAAQELEKAAKNIRKKMAEDYNGSKNPIQPFCYFDEAVAKELGYGNTSTTYV